MIKRLRSLALPLLLAASSAGAADAPFYFIAIADKGEATLFSETKSAPRSDLSYAFVDQSKSGCCFRAGTRPGARKAVRKAESDADGDKGELMSNDDKPVFRHAGYLVDPAQPEPALAYGFVGMQSVTMAKRDTYRINLQGGADPVFVHMCYTGEGMRLRLFHKLADKKPYASYYWYFGYDIEPTCR